MIRTLAWKELREHQGVWLTMVVMSIVLGLGLAKIVALTDPHLALGVGAITVLGMAATYGVVCGSMMLAGEHEGGTLIFLDVFFGKRSLLWLGKFAVGTVFAVTQALAVATLLAYFQPESPRWVTAIVGFRQPDAVAHGATADARVWFIVLPVVTLEAYFWGLLGSSLAQRVLAAAAVAAATFTPVWLMALLAPECFVAVRVGAIFMCLGFSLANFLRQPKDGVNPMPPQPRLDLMNNRKERFLDEWERFERDEEWTDDADPIRPEPVVVAPVAAPVAVPVAERKEASRESRRREARIDMPDQPRSPLDALWWLTCQQARPVFWSLTAVCLLLGLFVIPINFQVLWPIATLLLGVACGTAAFAPEQRDLSYQHLAAQHLPLRQIWRFRIAFWLGAAMLLTSVLLVGTLLVAVIGARAGAVNMPGTFFGVMGPTLFLGAWLFYGFSVGQVFVWLCRKAILALLMSTMVAAAAISVWLPSLLCGGMSGWQVWAPPLTMLAATCVLMRAWAGGRIWERKPLWALIGYGTASLLWALLVFGYRTIEVADVGAALDEEEFRASLPAPKDNLAAKKIQKAVAEFPEAEWQAHLEDAARLPVGVLDMPRADGQSALTTQLPTYHKMADEMLRIATIFRIANQRDTSFVYIDRTLALSRNLRNKASLEFYITGVEIEKKALASVERWLDRGRLDDAKTLRKALDDLHRHAEETPPPLDCVRTECFRATGFLANPSIWTFTLPGRGNSVPERWLTNSIAVAYETPWEDARRTRLWQLVWAGLIRNIETPHWELPPLEELQTDKTATREIMKSWLPAPGQDRNRVTRLLDESWLADERLFMSVSRLRNAATRSRWHVDATRQIVALGLYEVENDKHAPDLQWLVPRYLPTLPTDPYSGKTYHYRLDNGRATVWSTGPDRVDHAGRLHGGALSDDDPQWDGGNFDLILTGPRW